MRDIGRKSRLFHVPPAFNAFFKGDRRNFATIMRKTRMLVLPKGLDSVDCCGLLSLWIVW